MSSTNPGAEAQEAQEATVSPATRLCRAWVRRYTRRLPGDLAGERRAEVESDLWEHAADARAHGVGSLRHDLAVLRRVVGGMAADLAWRRHNLHALARADQGGITMKTVRSSIAETALVVAAATGMAIGLTLWPLLGTGADAGDVVWVLAATALSAALGAGLWLRGRRPVVGTALVVVGALAPSVAWFWLPPVYLLSVVITVLALLTLPRRRGLEPSPAV